MTDEKAKFFDDKVISFSSLPSSSYFIDKGNVFSCGRNDAFQLGQKDTSARYTPTMVQLHPTNPTVVSVGAGYQHTLFLLKSGEVYFVGGGPYIQNKFVKNPAILENAPKYVKIVSAGFSHSMLIDEDNVLWGFGTNSYGELGTGDEKPSFAPLKVAFPSPTTVKAVACGANFTVCITSNDEVYSWGTNTLGQLGVKSNDPKKIIPTKVEFPDTKKIVSVACGRDHCLALNEDGIVHSWGCNNDGQLGLGHLNSRNTPSQVGLDNVIAVAAGWCHSLALKKEQKGNNSLWGWGLNSSGQLGITDQSLKKQPWHISFFDEAKSVLNIACGNCHSFAVTTTQDLYAWGYNGYGQLGFGDAVTKVQPTLLRSNSSWHFGIKPSNAVSGNTTSESTSVTTTTTPTTITTVTPKIDSTKPVEPIVEISNDDLVKNIEKVVKTLYVEPETKKKDDETFVSKIEISSFVQKLRFGIPNLINGELNCNLHAAKFITKTLHFMDISDNDFDLKEMILTYNFIVLQFKNHLYSLQVLKMSALKQIHKLLAVDINNYESICELILKNSDSCLLEILLTEFQSFFKSIINMDCNSTKDQVLKKLSNSPDLFRLLYSKSGYKYKEMTFCIDLVNFVIDKDTCSVFLKDCKLDSDLCSTEYQYLFDCIAYQIFNVSKLKHYSPSEAKKAVQFLSQKEVHQNFNICFTLLNDISLQDDLFFEKLNKMFLGYSKPTLDQSMIVQMKEFVTRFEMDPIFYLENDKFLTLHFLAQNFFNQKLTIFCLKKSSAKV